MPILLDPEGNELSALSNLPVAWTDASMLEIGSGDGRLTWRYADRLARVVAIEPEAEKYKLAVANRPSGFKHVEFFNLGLNEFYMHVILSDQRPSAPLGRRPEKGERRISDTITETLQSPDGSFRVTQIEKFDLVLLSWSL